MPAKPALDATQLRDAAVLVARARREGRSSAAIIGELVSAFPISLSTAYRLRERPDFQALVIAAFDTLPLEDVAEEDDRQPLDSSIDARDREAGGVPMTPAPAQPEHVFEPVHPTQARASAYAQHPGFVKTDPQETIAEAGERPASSLRYLVPLWGDSDGWPRTPQEHAERDAFYTARRDLSEDDRIDYNTVVHFGGQPPPEKYAARREQTRNRDATRHA